MLKEDLVSLLNLPLNCEMKDVYIKARRYAKEVHSDSNPEKHTQWMQFEAAWDVIKRLHSQNRSFSEYEEVLSKVKWKPFDNAQKKESSNTRRSSATNSHPRSKANNSSPRRPIRGADIYLRERIRFDDLVYGCTLILKTPTNSVFYDAKTPLEPFSVYVPPTSLTLNKNGSLSQASLNRVFGKKIKVVGAGEKGRDGGISGDLIISFEVQIEKKIESLQEVINNLFWSTNQIAFKSQSDSLFRPLLGLVVIITSLYTMGSVDGGFLYFLGFGGFFGGIGLLLSPLLD